MRGIDSIQPGKRGVQPRKTRRFAALVASLFFVVSISNPVAADEYDSENAGHPLRMVAYVLHPVGVIIDYLLLRPAPWLGSKEPFKTAFGHED